MPIVKNYRYEDFPDWCELRRYEICTVRLGEEKKIHTSYPKAAVFPLRGIVKIQACGQTYTVESGKTAPSDGIVLKTGEFTITTEITDDYYLNEAMIFVASGIWPEWAKIAMFHFDRVDHPYNLGTPVDYYINTSFDNHYHDYDEYWMPLTGRCVIQSEGILYDVEPGDCICTRRGTHHQVAVASGPISSIGFGSRLRDGGETGFLWEQIHGKAVED